MRTPLAGMCCSNAERFPHDLTAGTTKATAIAAYGSQLKDGICPVERSESAVRSRMSTTQIVARTAQNQDRNRSASIAIDTEGASAWIARPRLDANTKTKARMRSRFTVRLTPGTGTRLAAIARKTRARPAEGWIVTRMTKARSAPAA